MSAPVIRVDDTVLGVLQISRKGVSPGAAGRDFDVEDLRTLEEAAKELGKVLPRLVSDTRKSEPRLRFHASGGH